MTRRSSSHTTSCEVSIFEINCGMTYSATVLRIQRTVVEHVILQFIWRCRNELLNDAFHSCCPEMSYGTTRSATVIWIWRTVAERVVLQLISAPPNKFRNDVFRNCPQDLENSYGIRRFTIHFVTSK